MIINDLEKHIAIGKEIIVYSKQDLNTNIDLKVNYRINKEDKEIRIFDVPKILSFQEKAIIYYAILDKYYFLPLSNINNEYKEAKIEEFVVKENGYTYHEFNSIEEESKGILAELLFEIPRQEYEPEKLSRIRDIYDMLSRNVDEIGSSPICIAFNGIMPDFKDVFKVIQFMFEYDDKLRNKRQECVIYKRSGLLGGNKRIFIIPKRDYLLFHGNKENDEK